MPGKAFFDTNVLIYTVAENDARSARAEALLAAGGVISVQVLNEFVSVVRCKMGMPWRDIHEALYAIRILCPSQVSISISTHEAALKIAEEHGYEIYDALILAAALEAGCATLYSEELHDEQVINGKLTIRNPFH